MTTNIRYAAVLEPQPEGGFTVTFPDIPEAITEGDDKDAALFNAVEVLTLCLEQRMEDGETIPAATKVKGAEWVEPAAAIQAALLMRQARETQGKSVADMARALNTSWPAAQRLEQPSSNPTLKQLERAAATLGKRLVLGLS
ncbi:MAG: type II toxin-antitoxin system HicB family antitoxin [Pseudomonadales bacterium]|jgi:antitoxin HicB|nr:type II toxin-antitoxin system HicB family antitoxin [Pseudomonadales bacterium]